MTTATEAPATTGRRPNTLMLRSGRELVVERVNGRKASQALKLIRRVTGTVKQVTHALGEFDREYAKTHTLELDRVQARLRYPRQPVLDPATREPMRDEHGELVLTDSPLDRMTAEDWERSGNVLRIPQAPTMTEQIGAVFDLALDGAEDELWKLLALLTMSNADLKAERHKHDSDGIDAVLAERADALLDDADLDELLELAVIAGEAIDDQFRRKFDELGERVGNAMRLLGIQTTRNTPQTPQEAPQTDETDEDLEEDATPRSNGRPTSSFGSLEPSPDGTPTPSSTSRMTSSSPSAPESTSSA